MFNETNDEITKKKTFLKNKELIVTKKIEENNLEQEKIKKNLKGGKKSF
jgi:hypothetical protein